MVVVAIIIWRRNKKRFGILIKWIVAWDLTHPCSDQKRFGKQFEKDNKTSTNTNRGTMTY